MLIVPAHTVRPQPVNLGAQLARWVQEYVISVRSEDIALAEELAQGQTLFRHVFVKAMGPLFQKSRAECDELANKTFNMFQDFWKRRQPLMTPAEYVSAYAPPSDMTQVEIDDDYEVEIASSAEYMAKYWDGTCRTRKGRLDQLGRKRRPEGMKDA